MTAIRYYTKAILNDPNDDFFYDARAYINLESEQFKEAIEDYSKALLIDKKKASYYGNRGWTYYLMQNYENCIQDSKKAKKYDGQSYYAMYNWALSELCLAKYKKALKT